MINRGVPASDVEQVLTNLLAFDRPNLFRQLAVYEEVSALPEAYESWCDMWHVDPEKDEVFAFWCHLLAMYTATWDRIGWRELQKGIKAAANTIAIERQLLAG